MPGRGSSWSPAAALGALLLAGLLPLSASDTDDAAAAAAVIVEVTPAEATVGDLPSASDRCRPVRTTGFLSVASRSMSRYRKTTNEPRRACARLFGGLLILLVTRPG